ncbi:MAG: hypothetical protein JJU35_07895 [Balneolales bacterium]|nr:hypothetical protein [Balneolales bacterium]
MQEAVAYDKPAAALAGFYEEELTRALQRFHEALTAPVAEKLRVARVQLLRIRGEESGRRRLVLEQLEALRRALAAPEMAKLLAGAAGAWEKETLTALETLPEKLLCVQGDERFRSAPGNSLYIKTGKAFKRIGFGVGKKIHAFNTRNSEKPSPYHFTQELPLRALSTALILGDETVFRDTVSFACSKISVIVAAMLLDEGGVDPVSEPEEALANGAASGSKTEPASAPASFVLLAGAAQAERITKAISRLEALNALPAKEHPALGPLLEKNVRFTELTGTFELPVKRFGAHRVQQLQKAAMKPAAAVAQKWQRCFNSVITDFRVELELVALESKLKGLEAQLLTLTHDFFRDACYVPVERAISLLTEQREILKEGAASAKVKAKIAAVQKAIQEGLPAAGSEGQDDDEDAGAARAFTEQIRQLLSDASLFVQRFEEELTLAEARTLRFPDPEIRTDSFKWRKLITRFLQSKAFRPLDPAAHGFDVFIEKQRAELPEAAGIADTNLQAAVFAITEDGEADPLEIAETGLQRAINTLEANVAEIREKQGAWVKLVRTGPASAMKRLREVMRERTYDAFELQDKALLVQEGALNWKERGQRLAALAGDKFSLGFRYGRMRFVAAYAPLARFLGLEPPKTESTRERLNLTEYLIQNKTNDEKLPFIYQRLFRRSLQIEKRFYLDGPGNLGHLVTGYQQWYKGIPWTMAIVGQKGSGKSTLIHFFKSQEALKTGLVHIDLAETIFEPAPMLRVISKAAGFSETDTLEALVEKFERSRKKRIIIFEGLQNLYLRNINGYEAIRQFWELISQTSKQVFWVVCCSRDAWYFFTRMFSADQFFSQVLRVDSLTPSQIEQGIMMRHRASGFEIEFTPSSEITKSRAFRKLLGDKKALQQYLQREYFEQLAEMADGNFSIAMIFWVNSISKTDANTITISPIEIADIDVLESPSREVQFTLASLVRHDVLTAEQLALALHQPLSEARLMLGRLAAKGLIVKVNEGYTINHLVYRQITRCCPVKTSCTN